MSDFLPVSLQDILYGWKSGLRTEEIVSDSERHILSMWTAAISRCLLMFASFENQIKEG